MRADGRVRTTADQALPSAVAAFLPTPAAHEPGGTPERYRERLHEHDGREGSFLPLGMAVQLLPTPLAGEGRHGGPGQTSGEGGPSLSAAAALLPTPTTESAPKSRRALTASSDNGRRDGGGQSSSLGLSEAASLLAGVRPANLPEDDDLPPTSRAIVDRLLPTPATTDASDSARHTTSTGVAHPGTSLTDAVRSSTWGHYAPAIERWEAITGRQAPEPTEANRNGGRRLAPLFVEWMMGLPEGWVTGVDGVNRNAQLKGLGNGVVPQQAATAITALLPAVPVHVRVRLGLS